MEIKKILLADDEANFRELIEEWIENFSQETDNKIYLINAIDGEDAIKKFDESIKKNKPFDVAIIDYFMPKFFGTDVLKHIVKKFPIPIIIISGVKEAEKIDFIKEGAIIFEKKPLSYEKFKETLLSVIDLKIHTNDIHLFDHALKKLEEVVSEIEKKIKNKIL
ncbi:hypothetical protein DRQ09_09200 [candidate division KSB1 bacterium]|nr:MAG: hypothetical protein DRQ09_09200 [candidate division KSB1 bacterium]